MVRAAVSGMGTVVQITFQDKLICLDEPTRTTPCAQYLPAGARSPVGSAMVEFAQTTQRAYINLYVPIDLRSSSLITEMVLVP